MFAIPLSPVLNSECDFFPSLFFLFYFPESFALSSRFQKGPKTSATIPPPDLLLYLFDSLSPPPPLSRTASVEATPPPTERFPATYLPKLAPIFSPPEFSPRERSAQHLSPSHFCPASLLPDVPSARLQRARLSPDRSLCSSLRPPLNRVASCSHHFLLVSVFFIRQGHQNLREVSCPESLLPSTFSLSVGFLPPPKAFLMKFTNELPGAQESFPPPNVNTFLCP